METLFGVENNVTKMKRKIGGSGTRFENVVKQFLQDNGWSVEKQYPCGYRLGKRKPYKVDLKASKGDRDILISCKYQEVAGSAPDKLPYEYMSLLHAVKTNEMDKGYLVLFGKELIEHNVFHPLRISEMEAYMTISTKVQVIEFEELMGLANRDLL